jgi:hypothetical protein
MDGVSENIPIKTDYTIKTDATAAKSKVTETPIFGDGFAKTMTDSLKDERPIPGLAPLTYKFTDVEIDAYYSPTENLCIAPEDIIPDNPNYEKEIFAKFEA